MKKLFPLFIAFLIFTNFCFAQSTVQNFFSVDWDASYKSIQSLFPKIKFTEKIFLDLREIYFNETSDSIDVKIGFFFNNNKELRAKAINNLGKDARSGQKFFDVFKNYAVEHFGDKYESQKVYSAFVITWNLGTDAIVILSHKDEKASLTITKKREFKNQKSD
ncbi:MAG: hypothetical protein NTZ27_09645 [Ignavibacteriales bacterium]|nr:hypothetical protein [Ignavibacteriales bacterium]